MDQAAQNPMHAATGGRRQMDFVPPKPKQPAPVEASIVGQSGSQLPGERPSVETPSVEATSAGPMPTDSPRPRAVTSAKDAINAMYAAKKSAKPEPARPVMTAREAVNAAASQNANRGAKSASSVHHGQIQKNLNSTRTSASALLRVAESPRLATDRIRPKTSFDPLARPSAPRPKANVDDNKQEIPVVRTSLKLGAAARPKPTQVVLPPNARMARVARPVHSEAPISVAHRTKSAGLLSRQPIDAQIIQPNTINPGQGRRAIGSGVKTPAPQHTGGIQMDFAPKAQSPQPSQQVHVNQPSHASQPAQPSQPRPAQFIREQAAAVVKSHQQRPAQAARFRTAPKNYATSQPGPIAVDSSYVMTTPPKLTSHNKSRVAQDMAELGMQDEPTLPKAGDRAPIGQAKSQPVAAGHGRADADVPTIKETNTSNYSFSRPDKPVDNNRYALGGESPFLKTVNVEKRPLSDTPVTPRPTIERRKIETKPEKPTKIGRKNVYAKKAEKPAKSRKSKAEKPAPAPRPTVIMPTSHRSKLPLFFLVLITIILGALVGAAAYLCFFQ